VEAVVAAEDAGKSDLADRLGIEPDTVVQELGWTPDVDGELRAAVEARTGSELLDEGADEVIDVVLLWWRAEDGDLVDALVDAVAPLAEDGAIWVLTPKTGREGHVEPAEIAEAVPTAGLTQTSGLSVGRDWTATRLAPPRSRR
jgi:hypothetical protein